MSEPQGTKLWRSLDALLCAYAEGDINQLDLFTAMIGLLDIIPPDVIYKQLPEGLRGGFVAHARAVVENKRVIANVVTGKPLPTEAFDSLATWVKSFPL